MGLTRPAHFSLDVAYESTARGQADGVGDLSLGHCPPCASRPSSNSSAKALRSDEVVLRPLMKAFSTLRLASPLSWSTAAPWPAHLLSAVVAALRSLTSAVRSALSAHVAQWRILCGEMAPPSSTAVAAAKRPMKTFWTSSWNSARSGLMLAPRDRVKLGPASRSTSSCTRSSCRKDCRRVAIFQSSCKRFLDIGVMHSHQAPSNSASTSLRRMPSCAMYRRVLSMSKLPLSCAKYVRSRLSVPVVSKAIFCRRVCPCT
mmetsp:Transcript_82887/g.213579  ORF Transcript_82887/g.213579 Transcript_82887/m.213579 type:complete len:259 (-) Transcript_82887:960-1736(-)